MQNVAEGIIGVSLYCWNDMPMAMRSEDMTILTDTGRCSGCSACYAICGSEAISMAADAEGFLHPLIDPAKCVDCGLCAKACPALVCQSPREPLAVFAAKANDDDLRMRSSSGGVFTLLSRAVIADGGIVFGAGFDHSDWRVVHKSAENEEELEDLRGSKYVQSDMGDTYKCVKAELRKNRNVLFTGTPCQIAGLRLFLGKEYDNLLLVDVICHAAPSPLAWRKYLENRLATDCADRTGGLKDIMSISFRRKNSGWKRYSLSLRFANDEEYLKRQTQDTFLRGFLSELYNRPSCHQCSLRELKSGSDITIGDYWNVHEKFPEMDDDKGTSLILLNTDKGKTAFNNIYKALTVTESDFFDAARINPAIVKSPAPHKNRNSFFKRIERSGFDGLVIRLLARPVLKRLIRRLKNMMRRFSGK